MKSWEHHTHRIIHEEKVHVGESAFVFLYALDIQKCLEIIVHAREMEKHMKD